jgi:SAM-dependent methyltransferase
MDAPGPLLYGELAGWFHLLTAPEDYAEEAEFYRRLLVEACARPPRTLLELGSGGGNNASHYKRWFTATLTDRSPGMLAISRVLNPECEHVEGDMRSVRLGRAFDAVFVHDAVDYLLTESDLRACMETAFLHCAPGGAALFVPDHTRENFQPGTDCGGHDGDGRALRYLEWWYDPDPADTTYLTDFAYLLREGDTLRAVADRHHCGLFARQQWLDWLLEAGFAEVRGAPLTVTDALPGHELFIARRAP